MITPKQNKSVLTNLAENIYFRVDAVEARLGKMNSSSPQNTHHDISESKAFQPSSPLYSPDSETFSSNEYNRTPTSEESSDSSLNSDESFIFKIMPESTPPRINQEHDDEFDYKWQYDLNHPVDMPNKRLKTNSLHSIPIPATVYMAVDNNSKKPLQPIAETDTDSNGGTPKPEATLGENYVQDLHNISTSRDLFIPSDRCLETTQIDEEYGEDEEMPEPK